MNDRAKYKGRMAIYAMAGVYLLAQAYYMYKDIPTSSGTDKILMSIFMVVFAVIGEECVFIDDNAANIDAAKKLGMKTILFQDYFKAQKQLNVLCNK